ncbi:UDP-glucosyltransferase 2-like [Wyeomyia smithii]|uniref:UDP-glucosyltransferase 2-like n=1 Tax=Wyeomyia smithii TaxID=174621 RepID=UPI002467ADE0|nr:UDP-glucosyltransferase 2-like [Wyeomyia smithii]
MRQQRRLADILHWLKVICVFGTLLLHGATEASRILCIYPSPGRSHVMVGQALLKGLAERGHEVTMVSPFKLSKPVKNYREILVPVDDYVAKKTKEYLEKPPNMLTALPEMIGKMLTFANDTVNYPSFVELKKEKFDLVIVGFFVADFVIGYGAHFNAPTVILWTGGNAKFTSDMVGNPRAIVAATNMMFGPQDATKFITRLKNFMIGSIENVFTAYAFYKQKPYYDWNFPSDRYPSYAEVRKNVSLVLLNTHFSHGGARPYLQNMVEVGGLQIKTKPDPLPKDIQEWLDGAGEHGAIYFCLGSNLKSSDLPAEKMQIFIESLGKLKQRILWKWETDSFPNQPANVMAKKWLPQDDVLAHKNIVLFIAHGGLGGIAEARYHGVPILGIPIFAEQAGNVRTVAHEGWGLEVDYMNFNGTTFDALVKEILTNPIYRQKAKQISALYRDRPQTAMETACFWVEYIIRHRGATHMHYQGADLSFIQMHMLDVIVVVVLVLFVILRIVAFVGKRVVRLVFGSRKKQKVN